MTGKTTQWSFVDLRPSSGLWEERLLRVDHSSALARIEASRSRQWMDEEPVLRLV